MLQTDRIATANTRTGENYSFHDIWHLVEHLQKTQKTHKMLAYHNGLSSLLYWVSTSLYRSTIAMVRNRQFPVFHTTQLAITSILYTYIEILPNKHLLMHHHGIQRVKLSTICITIILQCFTIVHINFLCQSIFPKVPSCNTRRKVWSTENLLSFSETNSINVYVKKYYDGISQNNQISKKHTYIYTHTDMLPLQPQVI